jgi:hypothetical protein
MATYKVWLTVKDSNGNTKEIDGGTIDVDLGKLTPDELNQIEEALPLNEYLKKAEAKQELDKDFATDEELTDATENTIKYSDFKLRQEDGGSN